MTRVPYTLPNDDLTDTPIVRPSGTGSAIGRALTEDEITEIAEREKRRVPLWFASSPTKPKRKRKTR